MLVDGIRIHNQKECQDQHDKDGQQPGNRADGEKQNIDGLRKVREQLSRGLIHQDWEGRQHGIARQGAQTLIEPLQVVWGAGYELLGLD